MAKMENVDIDYNSHGDLIGGHWHVYGSGKNPYDIKLISGVWSCSCPAWRNQSKPIDQRVCKHSAQVQATMTGKAVTVTNMVPSTQNVSNPLKEAEEKFAREVTLAHVYDPSAHVITNWWCSEKLDGVRCIWIPPKFGTNLGIEPLLHPEGVLLSRNGKPFLAPAWFKKALPDYPVDGELWIDRGKFQETVSIVRRASANKEWEMVTFMVFDVFTPALGRQSSLKQEDFSERYRWMMSKGNIAKRPIIQSNGHGEQIQSLSPRALLLPQWSASNGGLEARMKAVLNLGGEGLMLRDPKLKYQGGRTQSLLKHKVMLDDIAEVLGMVEGKGKNAGMMGALQCRLKSGTEFEIGTGFTDADRKTWWSINTAANGRIVEFKYQELTNDGVPRFPSFQRTRPDLTSL